MKIKQYGNTYNNDFYATYECEHCGHVTGSLAGYNDSYFHNHVIPGRFCPSCGKNRAGETQPKTEAAE